MVGATNIIVDSSCILSWLIYDEYDAIAQNARSQFIIGKINLIAPDIIDYEVGNCLRTAYSRNRLDHDKLHIAIELYQEIEIEKISLTDSLQQQILQMAIEENISFYDSAYLTCALIIKADLISLDKQLSQIFSIKKDLH